jgi:hypothetical protein
MFSIHRFSIAALAALAITAPVVAGCGSKSSSSNSSTSTTSASGPLSAEAKSTATGDIPDNQAFLTFKSTAAHYSIKYPEGWTQQGTGRDVKFQDKNNLVHIVVANGAAPTPASVKAELQALKSSNPTLQFDNPKAVRIGSTPAVKATYRTQSKPNPVTGKRVTLIVDRYELAKGGRRAMIDLGTPKGVDNVDAYRMMSESFRWQ